MLLGADVERLCPGDARFLRYGLLPARASGPFCQSPDRHEFLRFVLAICVGGVATHWLVPPTPGPLVMADQLGIDLGVMILFGAIIADPCPCGHAFCGWLVRRTKIVMRPLTDGMTEVEPLPDEQLPALLPLCCRSCCRWCWSR